MTDPPGPAPDPSLTEGETEALLRVQMKLQRTFLSLVFSSLPSSPVADDVTQPAACEDLGNPLLAASSHPGAVIGQVSTDLTAQR